MITTQVPLIYRYQLRVFHDLSGNRGPDPPLLILPGYLVVVFIGS
jgi:hypothetical protein